MNRYKHKVALVTGGASGIGRALGERLASNGAIVYLADIDGAAAQAAADTLRPQGGQVIAATLDVTDAQAFQALANRIRTERGHIDYLFNCAGLAMVAEVKAMTLEHWSRVTRVNIDGVVHGIHAVYQAMIDRRAGHIVNMGSVAGFLPVPGSAVYAMSKHALTGLTLSLRAEAAAFGVHVSLVCPGFVNTPLLTNSPIIGLDADKMLANPLRAHLMTPQRCADLILRRIHKRRAIITVTGHAWWLYRLYRFFPGVFHRWLLPAGMVMNRREYALPEEQSKPGAQPES
ncbi:MAG: SDR family oxidoreductase [Myxococcota bacterium]|nr:SDR family oxidoreductase [Myxococcota bacterium]